MLTVYTYLNRPYPGFSMAKTLEFLSKLPISTEGNGNKEQNEREGIKLEY